MEKKKELIISIVAIVVLVLAIVGVSFAAFNYSRTGEKVNTITSGAISMQYTETDNVIQIDKALPTTDATGTVRLKEGEYFDFSVSGTIQGTANINWEIAAEDITTAERKIDGSNIKLYLTEVNDSQETEVMAPKVYSENDTANDYTGRPAGQMSLYATTSSTSFTKNYRLRMYVDEGYNPQNDGGNLVFTIRINVYGKSGDPMPKTTGPVAEVLLSGVGENGEINTDDPDQTFITGTDPNNYIWYSGKLWRAVSIDPDDNSIKLVTQWDISVIPYNASGNTAFEGSYMEDWLNDTSIDGFLGNLRDYEGFIKTDSMWNATQTSETTSKPPETTMVTDPVGLLNIYEYTMSYSGTDYSNSYLNNGLVWGTLTPYSSANMNYVRQDGTIYNKKVSGVGSTGIAIRPVINLQPSVQIVSGAGTVDNPYRLEGDNDSNLNGTLLNTRYSGEYIRFGTGENNLYRIVSHENGAGTKITSAEPLKSSGSFIESAFDSNDNANYSSSNTIGTFLNGDYLTSYVGSDYSNMIEPSTTWYLGKVMSADSYWLAKYSSVTDNTLTSDTTNAQIGLLRTGELMSGQFDSSGNNSAYWLLTLANAFSSIGSSVSATTTWVTMQNRLTNLRGVKPAMNLKSSVIITGGSGTKSDPFTIALQS